MESIKQIKKIYESFSIGLSDLRECPNWIMEDLENKNLIEEDNSDFNWYFTEAGLKKFPSIENFNKYVLKESNIEVKVNSSINESIKRGVIKEEFLPEVTELEEGVFPDTGASNYKINDLILFTDNNERLVNLRDSIYEGCEDGKCTIECFVPLLKKALVSYKNELKKDIGFSRTDAKEYCEIYVNEYKAWKEEHVGELTEDVNSEEETGMGPNNFSTYMSEAKLRKVLSYLLKEVEKKK